MAETSDSASETVPPAQGGARRLRAGLSARLLLLTVLFVLIAEVLIYVPSVASFRTNWLAERLSQARAAALILEKTPPDALPRPLVEELLSGMETTMIALRIENARRLLAVADTPPTVDYEIDLRDRTMGREIGSAFDTLIFGGSRTIRVVGPPPRGGDFVEIIINEKPLREAMIQYSWTILQVSLVISGITALLVFAALNGLIAMPIKRLAAAVSRFRADPTDARSILAPDARQDEIGTLERSVSEMQQALQQELRQREHLANLGLAVAKINHDLRNMLASAQLMADRLGALPDPNVQRFVPKLMDALDRAITFCQSTLAYGKAQERPAMLAPVPLRGLIAEVAEQVQLSETSRPVLLVDIPEAARVMADAEHLNRVVTNLLRNARAALDQHGHAHGARAEIRISAAPGGAVTRIDIADNGHGIPPALREKLFRAFSGSTRPGGTGLGLAIAHELMRGMGGSIILLEIPPDNQAPPPGAVFRLELPAAHS